MGRQGLAKANEKKKEENINLKKEKNGRKIGQSQNCHKQSLSLGQSHRFVKSPSDSLKPRKQTTLTN